MSSSSNQDDKEIPKNEIELIRDIEDKCYKAFMDFDREGNGG